MNCVEGSGQWAGGDEVGAGGTGDYLFWAGEELCCCVLQDNELMIVKPNLYYKNKNKCASSIIQTHSKIYLRQSTSTAIGMLSRDHPAPLRRKTKNRSTLFILLEVSTFQKCLAVGIRSLITLV